MAENRVCEILNSVLKNKLNKKHATEQSKKLSDLQNLTIKAVLKGIIHGHKQTLTKSLPALDVAF